MMYYYAEMSFKKGLSNDEQIKVIEKIANNKGVLPPNLYQYFNFKNIVQTPVPRGYSQGTSLNEAVLSK